MDDETPIACTLTGAQMPTRLAEMGAIGSASLLAVAGRELLFRDDVATRERLPAVVAAESACCAFLDLGLERTAGGLSLRITGPDQAEPIVADLVSAFRGSPAA